MVYKPTSTPSPSSARPPRRQECNLRSWALMAADASKRQQRRCDGSASDVSKAYARSYLETGVRRQN